MTTRPEPLSSEPPSPVRAGAAWPQLALVLLPAVAFYALLLRFYTAVPLIDDYWHLLAFALQWHETAGAGARLGLLLHAQVGPYKLIFDHALLGLQLGLFGKLNFPLMILLGNLTVLGIFVLLWKNTPRSDAGRSRFLPLLPVSLLLFSLNYSETVDWAVSGLQQPAVILFSLAAVHFLVKRPASTRDFVLACTFGLLASATYANGVLVWPVGLLFLLLRVRELPRARLLLQALAWSACFLASLFVYLSHSTGSGITARAPLLQQALFLLSFCGGGMENMHHRPVPYISVVLGVGIAAVLLLAVRSRYDRRNPYFFFSMLWIVATAVVVANARVGMGLHVSLSSRYKIYCDLLLIFCYEYGLDRFRARKEAAATAARPLRLYLGASIAAALVFCVGSDVVGGVFLAKRKQRAEAAMRAYLASPGSASPMFLVEDVLSPEELAQEDLARQELNDAVRAGIYTPPRPGEFGFF